MTRKTHGLGKGLDALFVENLDNTAPEQQLSGGQEIDIGDIDPNPDQPRRSFDEESLKNLAESIKEKGVLQPLLVVMENNGRYRIVAGERRYRAARIAQLKTVPCIIKKLDEQEIMEIALLENLQREDLNPIETANGMKQLMTAFNYTQEKLAEKLCKSRPAVANTLRLLSLPEDITEMLVNGTISSGHGRVLVGVDNDDDKRLLAQKTVENGWNVRDLEKAAAQLKNEKEKGNKAKKESENAKPQLTPELKNLEERVRETTGMKTVVTGNEKKGKIVLQYYSSQELERFFELMSKINEDT